MRDLKETIKRAKRDLKKNLKGLSSIATEYHKRSRARDEAEAQLSVMVEQLGEELEQREAVLSELIEELYDVERDTKDAVKELERQARIRDKTMREIEEEHRKETKELNDLHTAKVKQLTDENLKLQEKVDGLIGALARVSDSTKKPKAGRKS